MIIYTLRLSAMGNCICNEMQRGEVCENEKHFLRGFTRNQTNFIWLLMIFSFIEFCFEL